MKKKGRMATREWLKSKGLTQGEWAEIVGVHHMTVVGWLRDASVVPTQLAIESIRENTPDCPLLREFKKKGGLEWKTNRK